MLQTEKNKYAKILLKRKIPMTEIIEKIRNNFNDGISRNTLVKINKEITHYSLQEYETIFYQFYGFFSEMVKKVSQEENPELIEFFQDELKKVDLRLVKLLENELTLLNKIEEGINHE